MSEDVVDWASQWQSFGATMYLNFAAHGATPRVALAAVQRSIEAKQHPHTVDDAAFFKVATGLRDSLAQLIGASPAEIAFTTGAGAGAGLIAHALRWRDGDEVLIAQGEFPMHYAVWRPMEQRAGLSVRTIVPRGAYMDAEDFIAALTPRTRLICASHVRFDDGSRLDTESLGAACRAQGAYLLLDVSQSCGALPLDVKTLGADFLVCAGYKYLLGPWGAGFLWAKQAHHIDFLPAPYNWFVQNVNTFSALDFKEPAPSPMLARWDAAEASSLFNFNLTLFDASVRFVLQMDPTRVRDHTHRLIDRLYEQLPSGCRAASPLAADRRGPFGCIAASDPLVTPTLYRALRAGHFVVALREGRIRIAPHLLNTPDDIDRLVTATARIIGS
jgi:selenocysteine lyase/cysteine desulfurase